MIALSNGTTTAIIDFAVANDPNAGSWAPKSIRVTDFLSPTGFMQIQVRAMDIPSGHISEGGFDKFMVRDSLSANVDGITTGSGIQPASWCEGNTITLQVDFTSTGTFTAGNTYTAELSDASGSFAAPTVIGTLASVANTGMITGIILGSTPAGTGYRIRVVSSTPVSVGTDNGVDLVIDPCLGLDEETANVVSIYPNPARSTLNILFETNSERVITLFSVVGEKVNTKTTSGLSTTFDVSDLPSGVYMIQVESKNVTITKHVIVR